ncbi:hypothetical protein OHB00_41310 [Streptomyces sp. NBC_00631]|uniref:hypothetical protein n=1 Tax=Streptomyces sp. NBC_00631 TaxID=2975793 RepID=UPI0030E2EFCD
MTTPYYRRTEVIRSVVFELLAKRGWVNLHVVPILAFLAELAQEPGRCGLCIAAHSASSSVPPAPETTAQAHGGRIAVIEYHRPRRESHQARDTLVTIRRGTPATITEPVPALLPVPDVKYPHNHGT